MGLEAAVFISGLNALNPVGATDPKSQGDDHIRLIKSTLLATFAAITGAVTASHSELNQLTGGGVVSSRNGAVGTPAFTWAGDLNTGFYRQNADEIRAATNGIVQLIIGTTFVEVELPLYLVNGAVGAPGLAFAQDTDTGIYRAGANDMRLVAGGAVSLQLTTTVAAVGSSLQFTVGDGGAGAPSYSFNSDPDTGMYRAAADHIRWACGGAVKLALTTTTLQLQTSVQLQTDDGSAGTPTHSFFNDTDIGMYRIGANQLGFATAGIGAMEIRVFDGVKAGPFVSYLCLSDSVAAPNTFAGGAIIWVDSTDGDLKVKFGDGTVKTIVVDT